MGFLGELVGSLLKGLLGLEQARAGFAAQFEIPILDNLLGVFEALLLGAGSVVAVLEMHRALPEPAVLALIDVDYIVHDRVADHRRAPGSSCAILRRACVDQFGKRKGLSHRLSP